MKDEDNFADHSNIWKFEVKAENFDITCQAASEDREKVNALCCEMLTGSFFASAALF